MPIHPTAVVDPQAQIDSTVDIGPYAIIEGPVQIGAQSKVRAHAFLTGWTEIGERVDIHPFAVVGHMPQDFHYQGERSYCKIGNDVVIREGATIHRGTQPESWTIIGDECLLMAYAHVGHNCRLGRGVKVYNMAALSGHVEADDLAIFSGYALVHQFVRIGSLAFVAGGTRVTNDVPPFMTCFGESTIVQTNVIGMRRNGYGPTDIHEIHDAFRLFYRSGLTWRKAIEQFQAAVTTRAGHQLADFVAVESKRGYCVGGKHHRDRGRSAETPPLS